MILPLLAALPVAAGPLWMGGAGLAARTIPAVFAAGLSLWLGLRSAAGYVPAPQDGALAWSLALAALAAASAGAEAAGARGLAWLQGLALVPVVALVSKDGRDRLDLLARAAAWTLVGLVLYQRTALGDPRPAGPFPGPEAWSGAALLLFGVAAQAGDRALALALLACLAVSGGAGAWLSLCLASVLGGRARRGGWRLAALAGASACLALLYDRLGSPEALRWWEGARACAARAAERPLLGWGPAASFDETAPFALRAAAAWGLPAAALWAGGMLRMALESRSLKGFGALAALIHGLWSGALWAPANLWLLSYAAACSIPEEGRGVNVPLAWRPVLAASAFAACAALGRAA